MGNEPHADAMQPGLHHTDCAVGTDEQRHLAANHTLSTVPGCAPTVTHRRALDTLRVGEGTMAPGHQNWT